MRELLTFILLSMLSILILATATPAAEIAAELDSLLKISPKDALLPVIIILGEQLNFVDVYSSLASRPRKERRIDVIFMLRSLAEKSQRPLLKDLMKLEKNGSAADVRSLWITNAIAVSIIPSKLRSLLNSHAEIAGVHWDSLQQLRGAISRQESSRAGFRGDETCWGIEDIDTELVWDLGFEGEGVLIANLDSGVDYDHPDLADRIWINPGEDVNGNGIIDTLDWNGIDDDANGYIDDLRGWDFGIQRPEVNDEFGSGTACAGIVAGNGASGIVTGMAPEIKMMVLKNYYGRESGFWEAMQYAIMEGADIVTSSFSFCWHYIPRPDYATMRHNAEMLLAAGITMISACGNEADSLEFDPIPMNVSLPACCPPPWLHPDQELIGDVSAVLAIGAYDSDYVLKEYSSIGPSTWFLDDILALDPNYPWQSGWPVRFNDYPYQNGDEQGLLKPDLCAPTDVVTTAIGGGYLDVFEGTEAASAHAAGALCLMLSADSYAIPEQLAAALMISCDEMGAPGKDTEWGCGRLNAFRAVANILEPISGTLVGSVTDSATGLPLNDIRIVLLYEGMSTETNSAGEYLFPGIPAGFHDLRFTKAGYDTVFVYDQNFAISQTDTLNVVMTASVGVNDPQQQILPTEFAVGPAYPNPFNTETIIPLELPQRSRIRIDLYNLQGRNLGTVYEDIKEAGWTQIRYDALRLASGVYFYRVIAEGQEQVRTYQDVGKMLLLK
jgi:subtilisin family serine protease